MQLGQIVHTVFNLMTTPKVTPSKNQSSQSSHNLDDALKDLNTAIEGWEKITSKPSNEQDLSSRQGLEKQTKELLIKLREQLNDLSKD